MVIPAVGMENINNNEAKSDVQQTVAKMAGSALRRLMAEYKRKLLKILI
jgi:hypothetical protein